MTSEAGLKIISAVSLEWWEQSEYLHVYYADDRQIAGLRWAYGTMDPSLRGWAKALRAEWNPTARLWVFPDAKSAQEMYEIIINRHPDWPLFGNHRRDSAVAFALLHLNADKAAILLPFPPPVSDISALTSMGKRGQAIQVSTDNGEEAVLILGDADSVNTIAADLVRQGVPRADRALPERFGLSCSTKVQVRVSGWAVEITFDLSNPLHYLLKPPQQYRWEGKYPNGVKRAVPWRGTEHTTRKRWPQCRERIEAAGLAWEGDDPSAEIEVPTLDGARTPGWESPAANGLRLHQYQREGIAFVASRGLRALIGDEMGIGKTAQAIGAAEAVAAARIVIICPANARYVWEREIAGWGCGGAVQHIRNQLDCPDPAARWHVVTYDQLVARSEPWKVLDEREEKALLSVLPHLAEEMGKRQEYPKTVALDQYTPATFTFTDAKRAAWWGKVMLRLRGELLDRLLRMEPELVIVDEAHRAKNRNAKRTRAIQRLSAAAPRLLLLTGTPLRNHEHEAAVLLSLLDAGAAADLRRAKGYTIQDVKEYLTHLMIRRTKAEVLPELPEKTRQRIDIALPLHVLEGYFGALEYARDIYVRAIRDGWSEAEARQIMLGAVEKARKLLGLAKVQGGEVAELVMNVAENKGCCVVFCAHHDVSDELKRQLLQAGLKAETVDGRTTPAERARIAAQFQDAQLDVFIGGINAAGEAITLTRSDTVIFCELDWVPAALLQAEDRIHRLGQRANCQVTQVIARFEGDNLDEDMIRILGSKMQRIGEVLDERAVNIVDGTGSLTNEVLDKLLGKSRLSREEQKSFPERAQTSTGARGPGRPPLPENERKRRRTISKRVWRQSNIEKQREYHKRWKSKRVTPGTQ